MPFSRKSKELNTAPVVQVRTCRRLIYKLAIFQHMHPGETLNYPAHRVESVWKEDPRDIMWEGSLVIHSPTQSRTIHPLELLTGLLLFFCTQLLTAYEVLGSACMAKSHGKQTCHLQAFLPNLDKEQARRAICPVHWGENQCPLSAPNHQWKVNCGPKPMKSAVLRRRWKGTSLAGALLMAPLGLWGALSSALTKESKQVI